MLSLPENDRRLIILQTTKSSCSNTISRLSKLMHLPSQTQKTLLPSDSSPKRPSSSATLILLVERFIGMFPESQGKSQSHKPNLLLDFKTREYLHVDLGIMTLFSLVIILENVILLLFKLLLHFPTLFLKYFGKGQMSRV